MSGLLRSLFVLGAGAAVALALVALFVQPGASVAEPAARPSAPALPAQDVQPGSCDFGTASDLRTDVAGRLAGGTPARACAAPLGPAPVVPEVSTPVLLPLSAGLVALIGAFISWSRRHPETRRRGS